MISGMINVYKEQGYTSHDVVAKLRGIVGQKKIGHTGTLDPAAEGVLPVCLGNATKVCGLLTEKEKSYRALLRLGITTDTLDMTGTILNEQSTEQLTEDAVREAVLSFQGPCLQIPPMYSARKIHGKRLYELAREGKTVEREAREIQIHEIRILEIRLPEVRFEVTCSGGTYIRTLCQDIGEKLGTGGCMAELLRTGSGAFALKDSHKLEEIAEYADGGRLQELLIQVDSVFGGYRAVRVLPEQEKRLKNGNLLRPEGFGQVAQPFAVGERVRVYDNDGAFAAIYEYLQEEGLFRAVKMFL